MEGQSLRRWALKELVIWSVAIAGGYLTFSSFEPAYDRARQTAIQAGLSWLFAFDAAKTGIAKFDTRIARAAPPLRGTLPGGQRIAAAGRKTAVLSPNGYGHFTTTAEINGQNVEFMTDTGATYVALSYETAQKLGLAPQNMRFTGRSATANGIARVATTVIDAIRIGDITVRDVQAVVAEPGRMTQNLLGMSFINQLSGFELNGGNLILRE